MNIECAESCPDLALLTAMKCSMSNMSIVASVYIRGKF